MRGTVLHVEHVAELLGLAVRTVHERTRKREIPCRKYPATRRVVFFEDELLAWLEAPDVELEVVELARGGFIVRPKVPVPA